MGRKAVLYGSTQDTKESSRGEEKSLYEQHKEKDMYRGGRGGGHVTLLYKKSWGDTGDDEVLELHRSSRVKATQREVRRPVTPSRLQRDFLYPPSRKPLGKFHVAHCKECRSSSRQAKITSRDAADNRPLTAPGEQQLSHARHVLRDTWVPDLALQRNQENVIKMITILRRQGKQRDADEHHEALVCLTQHATFRQEEKEAAARGALRGEPEQREQSRPLTAPRRNAGLARLRRAPAAAAAASASSPQGGRVAALQAACPSPSPSGSPPRTDRRGRSASIFAGSGLSTHGTGGNLTSAAGQQLPDPAGSPPRPGPAPRTITPEMASIDFYGKSQYKAWKLRKDQELAQAQQGAEFSSGRMLGGSELRSGAVVALHGDGEAPQQARYWRHRPVCALHPDNVHPAYKNTSHKNTFPFPKRALRTSAVRVAAVREGAGFIPEGSALQGSANERAFPPCTLAEAEEARKERRRAQQQDQRLRLQRLQRSEECEPDELSALSAVAVSQRQSEIPETCAPLPAAVGALAAAAVLVVLQGAPPLSCVVQPALGCGEQSSDDEPTDTAKGARLRVSNWRKGWHRMRARLDHDLGTLLHGRETARAEVCGDSGRLASLMSRAFGAGEVWARCRRRPQSGRTPPLPGSGPATQPPPRPRSGKPPSTAASPNAALQWERDAALAQEACTSLTVAVHEAAYRLWGCVDLLGSRDDTTAFRRRAHEEIQNGRRLQQSLGAAAAALKQHVPQMPAYSPPASPSGEEERSPRRARALALQGCRVEAEKAILGAGIARRSFSKVAWIFEQTAAQRSQVDTIVRPRSAMDWGRSIWDDAHDEMAARRGQTARAAALYARVREHCLQHGFPETSEQENFLYLLRELLRESSQLGAPLLWQLLTRAGQPALRDRDTWRICAFVRDELGVPQREVAEFLTSKGLQSQPQELATLSPASQPAAIVAAPTPVAGRPLHHADSGELQ
eukprot:TRINITY_DN50187_c0_g1_i1.p1 TRINITY_DN50187_c0_g1~~TRINITY_DN50187_c0_g1_i1.p1  ORF type:complete len:1006 (+),score=314.36 TRINITY_DN50187_c0_g1_i1:129-3020(+)